MMMDKEYIDDLITRYLSGQTTAEETSRLMEWRKREAENETYFRRIEEIWFSSLAGDAWKLFTRADVSDAYRLFCRRTKRAKFYIGLHRTMKYAAAVVLIGAMLLGAYWMGESRQLVDGHIVRIEAPAGSKTQVVLPDGTKVRLNAGSSLCYTPQYGIKEREVRLCGEAYFDVAHNKEVPFLVKSENLQVKVLGTKFDFRDYPTDKHAMVALSEGKVDLSDLRSKGDSFLMLPSDQFVLDKEKRTMQRRKIAPSEVVKWTESKLYFDEEPLPDVLNAIERNYNVHIVLQTHRLDTLKFYGAFDTNEQSIGEVMEILSTTQQLKYHIEGHKVTVN